MRAGVALHTLRALRPCRANRALRTGLAPVAFVALLALFALRASLPLDALRTLRAALRPDVIALPVREHHRIDVRAALVRLLELDRRNARMAIRLVDRRRERALLSGAQRAQIAQLREHLLCQLGRKAGRGLPFLASARLDRDRLRHPRRPHHLCPPVSERLCPPYRQQQSALAAHLPRQRQSARVQQFHLHVPVFQHNGFRQPVPVLVERTFQLVVVHCPGHHRVPVLPRDMLVPDRKFQRLHLITPMLCNNTCIRYC